MSFLQQKLGIVILVVTISYSYSTLSFLNPLPALLASSLCVTLLYYKAMSIILKIVNRTVMFQFKRKQPTLERKFQMHTGCLTTKIARKSIS